MFTYIPVKRRQLGRMQKLNGHQLTGYRADGQREFVDTRRGPNDRVVPCPEGLADFQHSFLQLNSILNKVMLLMKIFIKISC